MRKDADAFEGGVERRVWGPTPAGMPVGALTARDVALAMAAA